MPAIYNGSIIEDELTLSINDRAFQFGDGLFETIALRGGKPKHLNYHFNRLTNGCKALYLKAPNLEAIESHINKLIDLNNLKDATLKLIVWRSTSSAQAYDIETDKCDYLLKSKPFKQQSNIKDNVGFAMRIYFNYSSLSQYKTLNALPYILAAKERSDRNLDELIVLNSKGFVCECVSSNIFWTKDDIIFTPSIKTGCLDGVMRRVVVESLEFQGLTCNQTESLPKDLLMADHIFTTNSGGISFVKSIDQIDFKYQGELVDLIRGLA